VVARAPAAVSTPYTSRNRRQPYVSEEKGGGRGATYQENQSGRGKRLRKTHERESQNNTDIPRHAVQREAKVGSPIRKESGRRKVFLDLRERVSGREEKYTFGGEPKCDLASD